VKSADRGPGAATESRALVRIILASYTGDQVVSDDPLATAEVIANSRAAGYFVTPLLQDDRLVERWLRDETVPLQTLGPRP